MSFCLLHICSYYSGQKLYSNLFREISCHQIDQEVYVPVRSSVEIGRYEINDVHNIKFHYANILKPWHRFLYFSKISKSYRTLIGSTDVSKFKLVHAHCLFSDGG